MGSPGGGNPRGRFVRRRVNVSKSRGRDSQAGKGTFKLFKLLCFGKLIVEV